MSDSTLHTINAEIEHGFDLMAAGNDETIVVLESQCARRVPVHVAAVASVMLVARAAVAMAEEDGDLDAALERFKAIIDSHARHWVAFRAARKLQAAASRN
jgi:hypothetical protein